MQTFQCNNIPATARIVVRESQYQRMTISNVNTNDDGHSFTFVESLRDVVLISIYHAASVLYIHCFEVVFFGGGWCWFGFFFFFTIRECQSHTCTYTKAQTNPAAIREQETLSGRQRTPRLLVQ